MGDIFSVKRAPRVCARTGAVIEQRDVYRRRRWVAEHITMWTPPEAKVIKEGRERLPLRFAQ